MRFVTIVGTRPEFIKAWPISRALRAVGEEVLVHTGQHFDPEMSGAFFDELGLAAPDYELAVEAGHPGLQLSAVISGLLPILTGLRPDWVIVFGDTTSTLGGALAASFADVPIAHVEAGLRSFVRMPEERNRILVDRLASVHFCPSKIAVDNLVNEGLDTSNAPVVGDVNLDALREFESRAIEKHGVETDGPVVVLTIHRQENADDLTRLRRILDGVGRAGRPTVWPVHPRTASRLQEASVEVPDNVWLLAPLSFLSFLGLMKRAWCIVTDSGGVQKEAYWLGVPCITVRGQTEWVETVESGWNQLVDDDSTLLASAISNPRRPETRPPLYGDGLAAYRIARHLLLAGSDRGA